MGIAHGSGKIMWTKNVLDFLCQSVILIENRNKGDKMKIGSVVENPYGDIGIVIRQIGVVDRWLIQWSSGEVYGINGYQLEVIDESR